MSAKIQIERARWLTPTKQVFFYLLLLVCISLPFHVRVNSLAMAATAIVAAFHFFLTGEKKVRNKKFFLMFAGLYLIHGVALFNSENLSPVFFDLEKKLPVLVLPVIFVLGPALEQKKADIVLRAFVWATFASCALSFRKGFYVGYYGDQLAESLFVHRPYLGMYCVCSIFFCLKFISSATRKIIITLYVVLIILFFGYLFVLFAKMAIAVFCVLCLIYTAWKLIEYKQVNILYAAALTCLLGIGYFAFINNWGKAVVAKVASFSNFSWNEYDPMLVNSLNMRFTKWTCSAKILAQDHHWLVGAGTGDTLDLLCACYANQLGADSFFVTLRYNSHNQLLTFWLHLGLIPLILIGFHFIYIPIYHLRQKQLIPFIFGCGILLFGITESIMEVQKGIVFYSLFQSLFLFTKTAES